MIGYHDLDDKNEVEESLEDRRINKLKGVSCHRLIF